VNLAIGCLALLGLQQVHEGVLYCVGARSPVMRDLASAWAILLLLFLGLATGLWHRSRAAWWLTVGVVALVAFLHLEGSVGIIQRFLRPQPRAFPGALWCGNAPRIDRFDIFLLIARNVLLAAVPSVLLLGRLRQALAR
jgi:hypothetical protein